MSAHIARRTALSVAILVGVTGSAGAITFDVFDLALPGGWTSLTKGPSEQSWAKLGTERTGPSVTLFRSPRPFAEDPSAKAGRVDKKAAAMLGGVPATAVEWQSTTMTSAPLHMLVRCTDQPLADGRYACAMAGTAGTPLEPHRRDLTGLLDGIRLVGVGGVAVEPTPTPPPADPGDRIVHMPPDEALARIEVSELGGLWTGVWTRRPGSKVYDAVWRSAQYPEVRDIVRLKSVSGKTVVFTRDGNGGRYTGTLGPDGLTLSGTASWYSPGMTWTGRLASAGSDASGDPPPPPVRRVTKLLDTWNGNACDLTTTARFKLRSATQISALELWSTWRAGETAMAFELSGAGGVVAQGQLMRGSCDPVQRNWCTATASAAIEVPAGSYAVRVGRDSLCRNAGSGNTGFIRLLGMQ